ncbi:MAG: hypothetical protein II631_03950, partial [Treponema sp.]|nr:hypothetical protein [Treponema sp.]
GWYAQKACFDLHIYREPAEGFGRLACIVSINTALRRRGLTSIMPFWEQNCILPDDDSFRLW